MRFMLTAAAIAVSSFIVSTSANAQAMYQAGGPAQLSGGMCQVSAGGDLNYGYVTSCPKPAAAPKKKMSAKKTPGKKKS